MQARIVALTALCTVLLTGCSDAATPAPPAPATPSAGAPSLDAEAEAAAGIPPKPGAPVAAAYLADLRAIDPAIVGDKSADAVVDRGRDQCASLHDWPGDEEKALELTRRRFTAPSHPDGFDTATARKVLQTVRKHLCPSY